MNLLRKRTWENKEKKRMGRLVITIARGYGSGGRTMGRLLAEELGINFYDRELVRLASDKSGISEAMFGEVDERVKTNPFFPKSKKNLSWSRSWT